MRLLSNKILVVRERKQQSYGMIILPDTKICGTKNCLVLAAGKIKLKETVVDNEVAPADRIYVLQYDGLTIKAWDDLYIPVDKEVDESKLPSGVSIESNNIKIRKGTELQIIDRDDIQGVLLDGFSVDDQKI